MARAAAAVETESAKQPFKCNRCVSGSYYIWWTVIDARARPRWLTVAPARVTGKLARRLLLLALRRRWLTNPSGAEFSLSPSEPRHEDAAAAAAAAGEMKIERGRRRSQRPSPCTSSRARARQTENFCPPRKLHCSDENSRRDGDERRNGRERERERERRREERYVGSRRNWFFFLACLCVCFLVLFSIFLPFFFS